jgi:hypothetical protein
MVDIGPIKKARIKAKNNGVNCRYNRGYQRNILYCEEMIKYFDTKIRHLYRVKCNFEVREDGKDYGYC